MPDHVLQRAVASIQAETIPPGPPPELVAATLHAIQDQRVLEAIDKSHTNPIRRPIPHLDSRWRKFMSRPVPRFATAVLLAASVSAVYFLLFGTHTTTAFAQMVDSIIKAKTVRFSVRVEGNDLPKNTFQALVLEPGRLRQELPDGQVQIVDSNAGKMMTLYPSQKSAMLVNLSTMPAREKPANFFDQLRTSLLAAGDNAVSNMQPLGPKQIDGRQAEGFRLKTPDYEATLWGDPKTGRPILVEMIFALLPDMKTTMSHFEFDVELDEALFSLEPPEGYSVHQVTIGTPTEQDLIATLKLLSDHNQGTFPDALDNGAVVACITDPALLPKPGPPGSAEGNKHYELVLSLNQGIAFAVALPKEAEARYAGKGIKRGDTTAPVFWYRPVGASNYRVINADLSVKEQAAAPESTSGVPVNAGPSVAVRMRERIQETLSKAKERLPLPAGEPPAGPRAVPRAAAAMPNDPAAQRIIDRMVKAYADCKSYRDTGVATDVYHMEGGATRTTERPFVTAFVRPDRFRFEYRKDLGNQQTRYIIWSDGKEVQTWWDVKPGIEKSESLSSALGAAFGVSGGTSSTIAGLLMPDQTSGGKLQLLKFPMGLALGEEGQLGAHACYRVIGAWGNFPMTVWIDKQSHLVRRIDTQAKFPNFRTEETTTYNPIIDEKIADELLEFDPPVQK